LLVFPPSFQIGRIVEGQVISPDLAGKDGAFLVGMAADGDDRFHVFFEKVLERLRARLGKIEASLFHRFDRQGMDETGRIGSGAGNAEAFARRLPEEDFGHLGTARISRAENQHEWSIGGWRRHGRDGSRFVFRAGIVKPWFVTNIVSPSHSTTPSFASGLEKDDWIEWLSERGEPKFRAGQILDWLFRKRVASFDDMTNLGAPLREELKGAFRLNPLESVTQQGSADTTRKFLFKLHDGRFIETVLIKASPALYGQKSDRRTLCVSSQVGCAYDCKFCASGLAGFTRNLEAGEIVGQVIEAERIAGERINNIVFMGMGEPLANLRNLVKTIRILNAEWGVGIGARHLTVSTSGLAPQIEKLADEPLQIRLAISLHGASDVVREKIMPINRKYPIERLFEALEVWRSKKKQKITFEYILIDGVNDGLDQARLLAKRAWAIHAKVNLIPYNPVEGLPWVRPSESRQEAFLRVLTSAGIQATLRREKGTDIDAACGQLRLKEETAAGTIAVAS